MEEAQNLANRVVKLAKDRKLTLITAESCTAGLLAHFLAGAEGASDAFHGGFVTYTKKNKTKALGVSAELLEADTAVSARVAEAMANGALDRSPADVAVAVTGVTGAEPDEDGNPVGLIYVAAARRGKTSAVREHHLKGPAEELAKAAIQSALALAIQILR